MAASRKMRLRSGFNFRSPAGWDALSSVYEISMVLTHTWELDSTSRTI